MLEDFERKRQKEKEEELLIEQRQKTLPDLRISLLSPECSNNQKNPFLSLPNIVHAKDSKDQSARSFLGRFSSNEKRRLIDSNNSRAYLSRSLASFTASPKTLMGSSFDFTDDRGRDYSIKSVDKEEVDDG